MKKKALILVVAVALVLGAVVGGTVAFLTAKSEKVTNTFTVGKIEITLTETANQTYKVVPGGKSAKDPVVTVKSGSEKCYVYVLVENNLVINGTVVGTPNISTTDWTEVTLTNAGNKKLYRYKEAVDAASADKTCAVFTEVAYDGTAITDANISSLNNKTIVLMAYAHQSENTTQAVADAAAVAWAATALN